MSYNLDFKPKKSQKLFIFDSFFFFLENMILNWTSTFIFTSIITPTIIIRWNIWTRINRWIILPYQILRCRNPISVKHLLHLPNFTRIKLMTIFDRSDGNEKTI